MHDSTHFPFFDAVIKHQLKMSCQSLLRYWKHDSALLGFRIESRPPENMEIRAWKCYLHLEPPRTITWIYYNLYDDMHTWHSRTIMNDHEPSQQSTTKRCLKKDMSYACRTCQKHANARDSGPNHHVNTRSQLSRLCQQRTEGKRKIWTTRLFFRFSPSRNTGRRKWGPGILPPFRHEQNPRLLSTIIRKVQIRGNARARARLLGTTVLPGWEWGMSQWH